MNTIKTLLLAVALAAATPALADKPLAEMVELDPAQVQAHKALRAEHWPPFVKLRGEHQRQTRALRRAEKDGDLAEVERLSQQTDALLVAMRERRALHDRAIRDSLRPDQIAGFEAWLAEREAMVGSSRDARMLRSDP